MFIPSPAVQELIRHGYSNYDVVDMDDQPRDVQMPDANGGWVNIARQLASCGVDFDCVWKNYYPKGGALFMYFSKGDKIVANWSWDMGVVTILKNPQQMPVERNKIRLYSGSFDVVWFANVH